MRQSYYKEKFICNNELVNNLIKEVYKGSRSKYKVRIFINMLSSVKGFKGSWLERFMIPQQCLCRWFSLQKLGFCVFCCNFADILLNTRFKQNSGVSRVHMCNGLTAWNVFSKLILIKVSSCLINSGKLYSPFYI